VQAVRRSASGHKNCEEAERNEKSASGWYALS